MLIVLAIKWTLNPEEVEYNIFKLLRLIHLHLIHFYIYIFFLSDVSSEDVKQ